MLLWNHLCLWHDYLRLQANKRDRGWIWIKREMQKICGKQTGLPSTPPHSPYAEWSCMTYIISCWLMKTLTGKDRGLVEVIMMNKKLKKMKKKRTIKWHYYSVWNCTLTPGKFIIRLCFKPILKVPAALCTVWYGCNNTHWGPFPVDVFLCPRYSGTDENWTKYDTNCAGVGTKILALNGF